jgi:hypothetical protein
VRTCCGHQSIVTLLVTKTSTTLRDSRGTTFRLISSEKIGDRGGALTSRLQSLKTEMLAGDLNFAGPASLGLALIAKAEAPG